MLNTVNHIKRKPEWLRKKISFKNLGELKNFSDRYNIHTVCQEAMCPNVSECFSKKIATFLVLGNKCTRNCGFCNVKHGKTLAPDVNEPRRVAKAVHELGLKHVVITSVTRDDLNDGGSGIFRDTISSIKQLDDSITVEVLAPDFKGKKESIEKVLSASPEVFGHNLETVPRLYKHTRQDADYERSLKVLGEAKKISGSIHTKSGIMVGLGETTNEVLDLFWNLRRVGCDFLSVGQYLAPSNKNTPVKEYISPEQFSFYKQKALEMGFLHVESDPYVRSSYVASNYTELKS